MSVTGIDHFNTFLDTSSLIEGHTKRCDRCRKSVNTLSAEKMAILTQLVAFHALTNQRKFKTDCFRKPSCCDNRGFVIRNDEGTVVHDESGLITGRGRGRHNYDANTYIQEIHQIDCELQRLDPILQSLKNSMPEDFASCDVIARHIVS